jgi:hypothetical protein
MNPIMKFGKRVLETISMAPSFLHGGAAAVTEAELVAKTSDGRRCGIGKSFPAINMNVGDSIQFTWTVTLTSNGFINGDSTPATVTNLPPESITGNEEIDERIRHYHEQLNS